jgi:hypothetical protein
LRASRGFSELWFHELASGADREISKGAWA